MRKKLVGILSVSMVLAMTGCAASGSSSATKSETTVAAATTTAATTTAAETTTVAETTTIAETTTVIETTTVEETTSLEETITEAEEIDPSDEYETADPDFNPVVGDDDDYWGDDWGDEGNGDGEFELIGEKLRETFLAEVANTTDTTELATAIAAVSGYDCGTMEVEEGFLTGFSADISGFSKGTVFMPWIGSVPFIGYVFETEDTAALVDTLQSNADPRWNICTEAAETVVEVSGNLVFFAMCPGPDAY